MPISPSSRPFARPGSAKQVVIITLSCAAVLGGFYSLSLLGPSSYETARQKANISKEQAEHLRTQADEAERRWNELKDKRRATKTPFTEADLTVIGEAAMARFQYENRVPNVESHYLDLKKELHDRSGERLRLESLRIEKLAAAEEAANNFPKAEKLYAEALAIEERINGEFGEAACKNIQRTNYLAGRVRVMMAKPLWDRSVAKEKSGEAAYAKGDLKAAIAMIDAARADNFRLEQEFRGLTRADSFRTRKLEHRLDTLRSIPLRDRATSRIARAEKEAAERNFANLAELRAEAEGALRELVRTYPSSEYADKNFTADLTRRMQNAACAPEAEAVERDLTAFESAVHRGDPAAGGMIEALQRSVLRIRDLYPESDRIGAGVAERIAFLFEHRTEISVIGASVNAALRPMPGRPEILVLGTETPQRLYAIVMGENPSATRGDDRPVESLTRDEARLFCKHLGWLLARPVRLPDETEFSILTGKADAATIAKIARLIDNSDGKAADIPAAPADAAGFRDLFGNVAEWLESPPGVGAEVGIVAGGDSESTAAQLARTPARRTPAGERSRFVGFRFIVETPAATR